MVCYSLSSINFYSAVFWCLIIVAVPNSRKRSRMFKSFVSVSLDHIVSINEIYAIYQFEETRLKTRNQLTFSFKFQVSVSAWYISLKLYTANIPYNVNNLSIPDLQYDNTCWHLNAFLKYLALINLLWSYDVVEAQKILIYFIENLVT